MGILLGNFENSPFPLSVKFLYNNALNNSTCCNPASKRPRSCILVSILIPSCACSRHSHGQGHMKVFWSSSKEEGNEGGRKRDRFKGLFG